MSHVMATCDACGRYLSAARHPEPSGANPRRTTHRDTCAGPRLLETGSPKTQQPSLCHNPWQRRKPKTLNAQRPGSQPPGPLNASTTTTRHSRERGNPEKSKPCRMERRRRSSPSPPKRPSTAGEGRGEGTGRCGARQTPPAQSPKQPEPNPKNPTKPPIIPVQNLTYCLIAVSRIRIGGSTRASEGSF